MQAVFVSRCEGCKGRQLQLSSFLRSIYCFISVDIEHKNLEEEAVISKEGMLLIPFSVELVLDWFFVKKDVSRC